MKMIVNLIKSCKFVVLYYVINKIRYPHLLNVQRYLKSGKTYDDLYEELGVSSNHHQSLPLTILNYGYLNKLHPVVKESRGLVLHRDTHEIIARSFPRFFNYGEIESEFDFSEFEVFSKEDGSLVLLYKFEGNWYANTRNSFGYGPIELTDYTWRDLICLALGVKTLDELDSILDEKYTYVCELTSPYNKVVKEYKDISLYFLSAFEGKNEVKLEQVPSCFKMPQTFEFKSVEEVISYIEEHSVNDPTFEGVVIRDNQFRRYKIKSLTYVYLHRLKNNGQLTKEDVVSYILKDEASEILTYFPEYTPFISDVKSQMDKEYEHLMLVWEVFKEIDSPKEFAKAILGETRFASILFDARRLGKAPREIWHESAPLIAKILFR